MTPWITLAVLLTLLSPTPALALTLTINVPCFTEQTKLEQVPGIGERKIGNAEIVGSPGGLVELWVGADSGTVVLVLPDGRSCSLAATGPWQRIRIEPDGDPS